MFQSSMGFLILILSTSLAQAQPSTSSTEVLVKLASPLSTTAISSTLSNAGLQAKPIFASWIRVSVPARASMKDSISFRNFLKSPSVVYYQPNFKLNCIQNPNLDIVKVESEKENEENGIVAVDPRDNPSIAPAPTESGTGPDSLMSRQWGMTDNGIEAAWQISIGAPLIVAVIDTGVDYNHEDLISQMWRNTKEIPDNNIDDDQNGYVDDIVGWDTLKNDNKPFDLAATSLGDIMNGKNPGHGTHCAGSISSTVNNGKGIIGIAPKAQIMALRFIGDEGGSTEGAVQAILYAVNNGAKVLSNSWGSEGEDPQNPNANQILIDAIKYSQEKGTLFIAAAGNSRRNNDTDTKKAIPASYEMENIISVAALNSDNRIAGFSNYGATSVDLGAPGVKIMSTVPGNRYQDVISDLLGATWDGTSMAAPYVAGAAALYWSAHPEKTALEVKAAILNSTIPLDALNGRTLTGGKLSVLNLMKN